MIRAKDWVIFLENGVSLEELPMSEEHLQYCLTWLNKRETKSSVTAFDLRKEVKSAIDSFDFASYPSRVYKRSELWTNYDASADSYLVWRSE